VEGLLRACGACGAIPSGKAGLFPIFVLAGGSVNDAVIVAIQ
jgi:hypothetical protein